MTRICPTCKSVLGHNDVYFCSNCGNPLPADLIKTIQKPSLTIKVEAKPRSTFSFDWQKFNPLVILFLSFIITGGFLFIGYRLFRLNIFMNIFHIKNSQKNTVINSSASIVASTANVIRLPTDFAEGDFNQGNLNSYVPSDVDLLVEGNDISKFADSLLSSGLKIDEKFTSAYQQNKEKLKPSFVLFVKKTGGKYNYGLVIESNTFEPLIITNDTGISNEIPEVLKGMVKGIKLNPVFAAAKSATPSKGQFLIVVTNINGRAYLYNLLENNLPENLRQIIVKFLDSKLDYAVVIKG